MEQFLLFLSAEPLEKKRKALSKASRGCDRKSWKRTIEKVNRYLFGAQILSGKVKAGCKG